MKLHRRSATLAIRTLAATSIVALVLAAPAAADEPERLTQTVVIDEPVPVIPCANGKSVMSTFTLTRTVTTFFDQDGTPLREVRQARVAGRVSSEDGSRSVPYGGRIHRVFDFATGLVTVTGAACSPTYPGRMRRPLGDTSSTRRPTASS